MTATANGKPKSDAGSTFVAKTMKTTSEQMITAVKQTTTITMDAASSLRESLGKFAPTLPGVPTKASLVQLVNVGFDTTENVLSMQRGLATEFIERFVPSLRGPLTRSVGREPGRPSGLGAFIREQRRLANLSVRGLAELAQISNPYLSQLERGLSEPSVRVLNSLAQALDLSAEVLLDQAGLLRDSRSGGPTAKVRTLRRDSAGGQVSTEAAIRADDRLSTKQKRALLAVYETYVSEAPTSKNG